MKVCPFYQQVKYIYNYLFLFQNNLELRGTKIRINSICPAGVETGLAMDVGKMIKSMPQPIIAAAAATAGKLMKLVHLCQTVNMTDGIVYRPEFIAKGIMELITDDSKNGAILMVELEKGFTYVE